MRWGIAQTKESLFRKIRKKATGCWHFTGPLDNHGYGKIGYHGKVLQAHRLAWIFTNGEIKDGLFVCHKCDNPKCINPEHLFLGTAQDNTDDMIKKGRKVSLHGQDHPNTKLTNEQALFIRGSSMGTVELAEMFNVGLGVIYKIRKKISFKNIDQPSNP